jgi:hypothetical protein
MINILCGINGLLGVVNLVFFIASGNPVSLLAAVLSAGAFLLLWSQR